ncbi:MAG: hypothetical protein C4343_04120 [Chloroflexota bacterium]
MIIQVPTKLTQARARMSVRTGSSRRSPGSAPMSATDRAPATEYARKATPAPGAAREEEVPLDEGVEA